MNAAIIWIFFPLLAAAFLYILRRYTLLVQIFGIIIVIFLAFLAWQLPIGRPIVLGPWQALPKLLITPSLSILGRQFVLEDSARSALMIIYIGASIWFIGSTGIKISRLFIPLGLAIAAILTASISVEPFIYAALLIEMAVIICVPILSPPGAPVSRGVLRFLVFQTIGMILLVFSSWVVGQVELNRIDTHLTIRAVTLLALGFMMAMSAFPFNTWVTLVAENAHPYEVAFVFFTLPELVSLFAYSLFVRYNWLQQTSTLYLLFSLLGLLMIVGGGVLAFFQNNLGRILGYAVITEIGIFIITIGQILTEVQKNPIGDANLIAGVPLAGFFFALLLPRGFTLALWALALTIIKQKTKSLDFQSVRGVGYSLPLVVLSLSLAGFSLAGYPLLAGYPVREVLGAGIAQQNQPLASLTLLGYFGLAAAVVRSISLLFKNQEGQIRQIAETRLQIFLLVSGCLILFTVGLFPQIILSGQRALFP